MIEAPVIPLAVILTSSNLPDVTQLHTPVDAIAPIGGKRGRPTLKTQVVQDRTGYDRDTHMPPAMKLHFLGEADLATVA